jgi:zinc-ribbon domain
MAKFCTSCGSPIEGEQKFCNKCGSPTGGSTASPAPQSTVPSTAPSPSVQPSATSAPVTTAPVAVSAATAAPKKGSSAVKIIVAVVGFLAVVSVLAIGSCFYIGYKVKQKASSIMEEARSATATPTSTSGTPEMHLTEGGAGSAAAAAATVDVPPYPGSTPTSTGGQLSAGLTGAASAQEYVTDDSMDKVESFYKDKFGSKINIREAEGSAVFYYLTSNGMTTVTITRDDGAGKTKINIARIGK